MLKRIARSLLAIGVLVTGFTVSTAVTASPAAALCSPDPKEGDWHNIDSNTSSITRVIIQPCQPLRTCSGDICSITFDAATFMQPFGQCQPTDCDWGRKQAEFMSDGWIRTTHNFGFKTSYVWARTEVWYGRTYLRVWTWNDFTPADGRTDYETNDWMLK